MDGELFGQMVDAVGVGVGMYDRSGEYRYVNDAYAQILDTDRNTLVGLPIWEINDAVDPNKFKRYWDSYSEGETRKAETVHQYDGTAVEVQTITTRVVFDDEPYNVGTIQDITLRKHRQRQLNQLHTVTAELIEADTPGEIAEIISETAESILDYRNTVVRFRNDSDELEPEVVTDSAETDVGESWSYALENNSKAVEAYRNGETIVVDDTERLSDGYDRGAARSVMYLPIGSYGLISIAHHEPGGFDEVDVNLASILASSAETALRRFDNEQDLERQNERLEAFVDVISHDIPNHLTVAENRVDLAQTQKDFSHLDHVSGAHERIKSVISDMRTLVDHGRQVDSMSWVRLDDVIPNCWETCKEGPTEGTLEVVDNGYIRADESRFKQLLENLFWNALDHAGPDPTIRVGLLDDGIYIEDDGPGIPEELRENALSPGFTSSDTDDHSGFGLAIVREIARAHGWTVTITDSTLETAGETDSGSGTESTPGARFEITGATVRTPSDEERSQ